MAAVENQLAFGGEFCDAGQRFAFDQRTLQNFGTTPGGTFYATTPRGTRIRYDRDFLITCQNSPLAKTPPKNLPVIPGVTVSNNSKPVAKSVNSDATSNRSGTRITYDREFLLQCRNSPAAKMMPKNLPVIPGITFAEKSAKADDDGAMKSPRSDSVEEAQFMLEM